HPDDLVRPARSARHERSHLRDAARRHRSGARRAHRDRRAGAAGGAGARVLSGRSRGAGAFAGLILLCLLLWILTPFFLTVDNLLTVMEQSSISAIVAIGMTYVIVSGGIDLSVGSLLALAGVVLAQALKAGWPLSIAIAAAVATGAATGIVNGVG